MARSGRRRPGQRPPRRKQTEQLHRVLVVSEGSLTEPEYFERLNQNLRQCQGKARVQLIVRPRAGASNHDPNPEKVVQRCIDLVEEDRSKHAKDTDILPYARAFAVVDVDQWDDGTPSPLEKALTLARRDGRVDLVISNPQFEVWLLLHRDLNPPATAQEIISQCDRYGLMVGRRGKGLSSDFPVADFRRVLREAPNRVKGRLNMKEAAPSTAVADMVGALLKLIDEPAP